MKIPNIISLWQPAGASTHYITQQLADMHNIKTAHTGTLDPMAEGVIIVLTGETIHKKYEYAKWKKTYEFEMLFGLETDTYDGLGLVTKINFTKPPLTKKQINLVLAVFVGKYAQTVPAYSTLKINGKHLHWYARNNKLNTINLPTRSGEIYKIKLISLTQVSRENVLKSIESRINNIKGDLRQQEIREQWKYLLNPKNKITPEKLQLAKIQVQLSKGLYIRSLSQDIAHKLNTSAFVYTLIRTANGKYTKSNSKSLNEVFR